MVPLLLASRFAEMGAVLPALLRDAGAVRAPAVAGAFRAPSSRGAVATSPPDTRICRRDTPGTLLAPPGPSLVTPGPSLVERGPSVTAALPGDALT
jgi:hypothetical protein